MYLRKKKSQKCNNYISSKSIYKPRFVQSKIYSSNEMLKFKMNFIVEWYKILNKITKNISYGYNLF